MHSVATGYAWGLIATDCLAHLHLQKAQGDVIHIILSYSIIFCWRAFMTVETLCIVYLLEIRLSFNLLLDFENPGVEKALQTFTMQDWSSKQLCCRCFYGHVGGMKRLAGCCRLCLYPSVMSTILSQDLLACWSWMRHRPPWSSGSKSKSKGKGKGKGGAAGSY